MGCNRRMTKSARNPWLRPIGVAALGTALLLAGCALPKVSTPTLPPPVSAAPLPAASSGAWVWSPQIESAGSKLRSGLFGSGADVSQTSDQRLWISLPADTTFAAGRSAVTPAAGAWLDQVAASLRALPRAEVQIVGPVDAKGGAALAVDRAASARDWMVMRGVPARRMAVSGQAPRGRNPGEGRLDILIGERNTP
jgi:outer membrane protein OmpA-like peptidoglycan-associated protein